jgi:apolipoprotein N-acyltransferase
MLYLVMSFGVSLPFLILWDREAELKAMLVIPAFLIAYLHPPLSLIGVINPLIASGAIFRGWGFAGMITMLAVYVVCAVSRKGAYLTLCFIAMLAVLPGEGWYVPPTPEGIIAVDTSFGRLGSGSFNFEQDYDRVNMVFKELGKRNISESDAKVILLPETIAGRLNRTGLELWEDEIQKLALGDKAVIFGAELPTDDGKKYDNVILMAYQGKITYIRQRIPVPYSMYAGPFAETGANLHLWDSGVMPLPDNRQAAVIVCYEAFLTWPFITSMIQKPDVIISTANLWWCRETSLPKTQRSVVSLWALTFGVPAVLVKNM